MVLTTVEAVENSVRGVCDTKGIRIESFFLDYDKLRSGFVTGMLDSISYVKFIFGMSFTVKIFFLSKG